MNKNIVIYEDEIDLKELFQIIWERKIFILLFTLFITLIAGIYVFNKKPIYEVKSYIELAYFDDKILEEVAILEQKLKVIFLDNDLNLENGKIISIQQIKGIKNLLEIKSEAFSNEIALNKNKEILKYIQAVYEPKIEQYKFIIDKSILDTKREIDFINNIEIKNIQRQIDILKEQELKNIDRQIDILKTQDIENINKEIILLRTQEIPTLKKQIEFFSNSKIKSLEDKIDYYSNSLKTYVLELDKLNKNIEKSDNSTSMIVSVQILNYQNLITNAQNQIKDLELQIEVIQNETIPKLKYKLENLSAIQIKDLENKKKNILNVNIKDLQNKKLNVSNETIRKLEDKIDIEFQTKIIQLNEKIDTLNFKKSEENLSNSKLVGDYIVNDYPVKPKKSLILSVSLVTGFILSIFIVFGLNFFNKTRKEFT
ncbi:Wzz/FepE/Etk N-terminal domain-containing protein [Aliarcobacter butzleri]|uniref:Wzz/FepE/Etk N-terminal domain-containing protein n=1 Tax=Aliarcobacter butzleri TaxID=28197 RepID=UPI0021B39F64|nr:Wzz/FepE/Etk N-terminal domain-containing protein [Aliarcobacter butzleri]MCT7618051.1 Wzz/FepE/Etk N-terminal domain-containing protein [Aliarcobacter butzleri]